MISCRWTVSLVYIFLLFSLPSKRCNLMDFGVDLTGPAPASDFKAFPGVRGSLGIRARDCFPNQLHLFTWSVPTPSPLPSSLRVSLLFLTLPSLPPILPSLQTFPSFPPFLYIVFS